MSEMINNREYRQKVLKELIMELHHGKSVEEVRERFAKLIEGVSASEISNMEQSLIMEGMPVEEVQRLCDVHAAVFKGSIEEIHRPVAPEEEPGHPIHTFRLENREIEKLVNDRIKPMIEQYRNTKNAGLLQHLVESFKLLWSVDKHYSRKENLVFPYLEQYQITAPPKVMWGVDDEIREGIKALLNSAANIQDNVDQWLEQAEETANKVTEMVFKEENILFPMTLDTFTEDEWMQIARESGEIGYCLIPRPKEWNPARKQAVDSEEKGEKGQKAEAGVIRFETGVLSFKELNALLNHLPVDITFVDKNDVVKYFSQSPERIFPRPKTVIGRKVQNCHPPASVHIVEKIVEDFKAGRKDHEDFWIRKGNLVAYIRYFAVRDESGEYLGTLEVTQNIKPIQELQGEKRLVTE